MYYKCLIGIKNKRILILDFPLRSGLLQIRTFSLSAALNTTICPVRATLITEHRGLIF